ncbi:glycosyl hydrolase family 28 protein [Bythopirellula polymerisocia]|uniref:Glycosyl hydrolases family 28 n=1 Tax=Bythopirellula polymerisocia TaxID=2528003 RepID=A0A5C6D2X3_9BACT|nr:glycosyl hydrolase family 28 protein [Bythopirellula polymerisocia]TWU30475.1 Glycosyl hydrolases family 28 [Bythopirellula polymerisocia]
MLENKKSRRGGVPLSGTPPRRLTRKQASHFNRDALNLVDRIKHLVRSGKRLIAAVLNHQYAPYSTGLLALQAVRNSCSPLRIKTDRKNGGPVSNMLNENIAMKDVAGAITITCYYPKIPAIKQPKLVNKTTPEYGNITIRNLTATSTRDAGFILDLPESPIKDMLLMNVKITSDRAGLGIRHVEITPAKGEPVIVKDAEIDE